MDILIEFGKILIPSSIVLYAVVLVIRSFLSKEIEIKKMELKTKTVSTVITSRLQAYERMTLFLERMAPENLLVRLSDPTISASRFHAILLSEIRAEYDHNISQQIYMSQEVWDKIKTGKETLMVQISEVASTVDEKATSVDLSKKILHYCVERNTQPLAEALWTLKKEIQQIF